MKALQQAAAASGHLAPGEMPNALQNPQVDASGHITGQLHAHMEHQMAPPNQVKTDDSVLGQATRDMLET